MNDSKLGQPHDLRDIFLLVPDQALPMIDFYAHLMRGPSLLSAGERELIYAYTSQINGCHFCATSHGHCAIALGVSAEVFKLPPERIDTAPLSDAEKHRLAFACTLQKLDHPNLENKYALIAEQPMPAQIDTVLVVALTAFINRLIDGLAAITTDEAHARAGQNMALYGYTRVRSEVERSIRAIGQEPVQVLPGTPAGWPGSASSPQRASQDWLAAYAAYVFTGPSELSLPLRAAIRDAVFAAGTTADGDAGQPPADDGSANALRNFAISIGIDKRRSAAADFDALRAAGWTSDRDVIDAVLAAATAACSLRLIVGFKQLGLSA